MATDPNVASLGWTDEQWNRVRSAVAEEASRARVGATFLPVTGPLDRSTIAIPDFGLSNAPVLGGAAAGAPANRFEVDSLPDLELTRISTLIYLRSHEVADPSLTAALGMFRRAANVIARVEDAAIFIGDHPIPAPVAVPPPLVPATRTLLPVPLNQLVEVSAAKGGNREGLLPYPLPQFGTPPPPPVPPPLPPRRATSAPGVVVQKVGNDRAVVFVEDPGPALGQVLVHGVVAAITELEDLGHFGPFACVLGTALYEAICTPTATLVLPKDRIDPFVNGQLYRSGTIPTAPDARGGAARKPLRYGMVVALGGAPVELVVATDIHVTLLQASLEPRWVFRVSERIALRLKEPEAVTVICAHEP
jgi:uncharacterized linocin/CFP29 family protein